MDTLIKQWNTKKKRLSSFANSIHSKRSTERSPERSPEGSPKESPGHAETDAVNMDTEPILRPDGPGYASNLVPPITREILRPDGPGYASNLVPPITREILRPDGPGYASNLVPPITRERKVAFDNPAFVDDEHGRRESQDTIISQQLTWDIFEETPVDNFTHNNPVLQKMCMINLKTLTGVFLFLFVLGNSLVSRITFLEIVQQLRLIDIPPIRINNNISSCSLPSNSTTVSHVPPVLQIQWIWANFLVICFPYCITIVKNLRRMLFKNSAPISTFVLLVTFVIETIHSFGLLMLVFIVLTSIDPARSSMLIYGVGFIPCLLDILPTRRKGTTSDDDDRRPCLIRYSNLIFKTVLIAVFVSLAILLICFYRSLSTDYSNMSNEDLKKFKSIYYIAPISLILISLKYWNLFSDRVLSRERYKKIYRQKVKISILISILKIGYTLLFIYVLYGSSEDCSYTLFAQSPNAAGCGLYGVTLSFSKLQYKPFFYALVNMVAGYLCFNFARTACQLMIQQMSFSLPLILTGPISTILVLIFSSENFSLLTMKPRERPLNCEVDVLVFLKDYYKETAWRIFVIGFYLSFIYVTRHVWVPKVEKLAKEGKLFASTEYCGALLDQSLLLSRRRDKEKKVKHTNTTEPRTPRVSSYAEKMKKMKDVPLIYACATMWHETENEMMQLMKSLFRMGFDQSTRRYMRDVLGVHKDYYEFEAHIFFDDAFKIVDKKKGVYRVNEYVKTFLKYLPKACNAIHEDIDLGEPKKLDTPYGGRLEWDMPGGTPLVVHLKNKRLIRHKKRWSQVMYMYYFLGLRIAAEPLNRNLKETRFENTFLLALDGDVDFEPAAVHLLVDRMTRNPKVGAACGRIHPIGTGPMVWYQKFEYAVSHWLQKSTEHMIGCVLCSPGCFSLFRGSALSSENVLRRYTTIASEAKHKVQYDQGEDRWLCTLLLQQGYRVEYCAASDALTYCPETFIEFFKQRRRWAPSTMANIMDLLMDWQNVRRKNDSISITYIFYQACLMGASIVTPGTIFMLVVGALHTAYDISLTNSLILNLIPVILMMLLCFMCSEDVQLQFASAMSLLYAMLMMVVIVGLAKEISLYLFCSTTTVLFSFVCGTFILSALLHPKEIFCLLHGILYFILIPAMSILLMFYALGNLQNVSWGTRDSKAEQDETAEEAKVIAPVKPAENGQSKMERLQNLFAMQRTRNIGTEAEYTFSFGRICRCLCLLKEETSKTDDVLLEVLHTEQKINEPSTSTQGSDTQINTEKPKKEDKSNKVSSTEDSNDQKEWIDDEDLVNMQREEIDGVEQEFWQKLIKQYLPPEHTDKAVNEEKLKQNLVELRNHVCMFFCLINALFVIIVFTIELSSSNSEATSISLPWCNGSDLNKKQTNAITVVFLLVFGLTLLVQLLAMLFHRYETFIHILASIDINPKMMNQIETEHFWAGFGDNDPDQSDAESVSTTDTLDISRPRHRFIKKRKKRRTFQEKMDKKFSSVYRSLHENTHEPLKHNKLKPSQMSWMVLLSDPEIKKQADSRMKWIKAKEEIIKKNKKLRRQPKFASVVELIQSTNAQQSSGSLPTLSENLPDENIDNNCVLTDQYDQTTGADMNDKVGSNPTHKYTTETDQMASGWDILKTKKKDIALASWNQTTDRKGSRWDILKTMKEDMALASSDQTDTSAPSNKSDLDKSSIPSNDDQSTRTDMDDQVDSDHAHQNTAETDQKDSRRDILKTIKKDIALASSDQTPDPLAPSNKSDIDKSSVPSDHRSIRGGDSDVVLTDINAPQNTNNDNEEEEEEEEAMTTL